MEIVYDRTTLTVLHDCDVAVTGGSFGGVAAALTLARAGRRVALVEPRTYLGREISATLRPWVRVPRGGGVLNDEHRLTFEGEDPLPCRR